MVRKLFYLLPRMAFALFVSSRSDTFAFFSFEQFSVSTKFSDSFRFLEPDPLPLTIDSTEWLFIELGRKFSPTAELDRSLYRSKVGISSEPFFDIFSASLVDVFSSKRNIWSVSSLKKTNKREFLNFRQKTSNYKASNNLKS